MSQFDDEEEYDKPFIQTLDTGDNSVLPDNENWFGLIFFVLVSMIYVCSYEIAGMIAILKDTGELVVPEMVKSLQSSGTASGRSMAVSQNYFLVAFMHMSILFMLCHRREELHEKIPSYAFAVWVVIVFLCVRVNWKPPSECVSEISLSVFSTVRFSMSVVYHLLTFIFIIFATITKKVILQLPFRYHENWIGFYPFIILVITRQLGKVLLEILVSVSG